MSMCETVALLCPQDDLRRRNAAGAAHFTAFTLAAQKHPVINSLFPRRPETLGVRPRLFGTGKIRINREHGAVFHADRAANAVFRVHCRYPAQALAAAYPVDKDKPFPQPYFKICAWARIPPQTKIFFHGVFSGRKAESTITPALLMS